MKALKIVLGIVFFALGVLWALQGADLIRIKPILCVANCEPLVGGSVTWLIVGVGAIAVGIGVLITAIRQREL